MDKDDLERKNKDLEKEIIETRLAKNRSEEAYANALLAKQKAERDKENWESRAAWYGLLFFCALAIILGLTGVID